jgi:hypothetical protein
MSDTRTAWQPYPTNRFVLPADGKVTGAAEAVFYGDGRVGVLTTDAHVNDDNPAIDFRGESWLVNLRFVRQSDEGFTFEPDNWGHITRRETWSHDIPRTYYAAIVEAIRAHLPAVWTAALDTAGRSADVAQNLHRLEGDAAEIADRLHDVRDKIRAERKRLS